MYWFCNRIAVKLLKIYFANVSRPTLFSGLDLVFEWQTMLTASCWAWSRLGMKSPFRMNSLLSTLKCKNIVLNHRKTAYHQAKSLSDAQPENIIKNNKATPLDWNDIILNTEVIFHTKTNKPISKNCLPDHSTFEHHFCRLDE